MVLDKFLQLEERPEFNLFSIESRESLFVIAFQCIQEGLSDQQILTFMFNPVIPDLDALKTYRTKHSKMYEEPASRFAEKMFETDQRYFGITACMHGGKSTLAFKIKRMLEKKFKKKINVFPMIPFFMQEPYITIRGERPRAGDTVDENGFIRIEAKQYDPNTQKSFFDALGIDPSKKTLLWFDESTFMSEKDLSDFVKYIEERYPKNEYPQLKILFVGLNSNYMAEDTSGFGVFEYTINNQFVEGERLEIEVCKSFVPGVQDLNDSDPMGELTMRYVVFPDGFKVLDVRTLPLIVSKDIKAVLYASTTIDRHPSRFLQRADRADLVQEKPENTFRQNQLLETLASQHERLRLEEVAEA